MLKRKEAGNNLASEFYQINLFSTYIQTQDYETEFIKRIHYTTSIVEIIHNTNKSCRQRRKEKTNTALSIFGHVYLGWTDIQFSYIFIFMISNTSSGARFPKPSVAPGAIPLHQLSEHCHQRTMYNSSKLYQSSRKIYNSLQNMQKCLIAFQGEVYMNCATMQASFSPKYINIIALLPLSLKAQSKKIMKKNYVYNKAGQGTIGVDFKSQYHQCHRF